MGGELARRDNELSRLTSYTLGSGGCEWLKNRRKGGASLVNYHVYFPTVHFPFYITTTRRLSELTAKFAEC